MCVCLPPLLARFCLSSSRTVGNNLPPLSLCAAPTVACCPLHLLCITAARSESCAAPTALRFLNFLLLPSGGRLSPAALASPLLPSPPVTSCEFDFSTLSGSRSVFCRPSALPPSVHTSARFHPPCLFSSAGSTPQPTLKRRSSL